MKLFKGRFVDGTYLCFPGDKPPLYMLSLKSYPVFRAGFDLINFPGMKAFLVKRMKLHLYWFSAMLPPGGQCPLKGRIREQKDIWLNLLSQKYPDTRGYNFYIHSENRILIQVIHGGRRSYVKVVTGDNRNLVKREGSILEYLNEKERPFLVPPVEIFASMGDLEILGIGSFKMMRSVPSQLNERVVRLSAAIFKSRPGGLIHGDFKPWNLFWLPLKRRYFVIDWEDWEEGNYPLYDLFTYTLLTEASLNIGIHPSGLQRVVRRNMKYYGYFLKLIGENGSRKAVLRWLKIFLEKITERDDYWNRWDKEEKRPAMIRESLVKFYDYLIERGELQ